MLLVHAFFCWLVKGESSENPQHGPPVINARCGGRSPHKCDWIDASGNSSASQPSGWDPPCKLHRYQYLGPGTSIPKACWIA